ncbi:MAG: DCL family protein [Aestuariivirga sp.]
MGKKMTIVVGGLSFQTKQAAAEHFRQILYRYEIGQDIPEPDATELSWLLERHSEAADKIGVGVSSFRVRDAIYNTRCFEVLRQDGSNTDFSFKNCVDGKPASVQSQVLLALRAEVTGDILNKKRAWFAVNGDREGKAICPISGATITFEDSHADHAPPRTFGTLAIGFLTAKRIAPAPELITPSTDNQYVPRLLDQTLAKDWIDYHHSMAVIRVVARGANLARAHEGKVRKDDRQLLLRSSTSNGWS